MHASMHAVRFRGQSVRQKPQPDYTVSSNTKSKTPPRVDVTTEYRLLDAVSATLTAQHIAPD